MFEVCDACGKVVSEGELDPVASTLTCPGCGHAQVVRRLPLFTVVGASGTGKSTLARAMSAAEHAPDLIYLDSDILLIEGVSDRGRERYSDIWLWLCANLHQSGRPVVLFGAPFQSAADAGARERLFPSIHTLVLACEAGELGRRLRARPDWRGTDEAFISAQVERNEDLRRRAVGSGDEVLETAGLTIPDACRAIGGWIRRRRSL